MEDYKLVFKGPSRAEIIVYEKSVVGYVSYMSSYMYFDMTCTRGKCQQKAPWHSGITGLKFGHIVLTRSFPCEV